MDQDQYRSNLRLGQAFAGLKKEDERADLIAFMKAKM
jgi:hypothetical protein